MGVDAAVRLVLETKSDEELWWLFLTHGEDDFPNEFWKEVRSRQKAGMLHKDSPFRTAGIPADNTLTQEVKSKGKLITVTQDDWFSRRQRVLAKGTWRPRKRL